MPKMTQEHKQALAEGRRQSKAVRNYLEALEENRKRTPDPEKVRAKLEDTEKKITTEGNPVRRVELIQERLDLEARLADAQDQPDLDALEKAFKKAVKDYSDRKDISYTAWRELGVPASALRDAGVPRTRRTA